MTITFCHECGSNARLSNGVLIMECKCSGFTAPDAIEVDAYLERVAQWEERIKGPLRHAQPLCVA